MFFCFLSFFSSPYTVYLGAFFSKRLTILHLEPPTMFVTGSGIQLIHQSYQVLLIGLIFFIYFSSKLSISSTDSIAGSISLLIFNSLSFNSLSSNSIESFSNSKRLFSKNYPKTNPSRICSFAY